MSESPLDDIRIGQVTHQWAQAQKIPAHYFPSIDSTNLKAKADAFIPASLDQNLVIYLADKQTAGKGRGQNTWSNSSAGAQLLSTWSFMVDQAPQPTVSPLLGLALYRAASSTWPFLKWNLKAPNDLYVGDKKIAGILLETVSQGDDQRLLVGLGLNVISSPEGVSHATSLVSELPADLPLLAEDWIAFLERLVFEFALALQLSFEPLSSTSTGALLFALNQHPLLKENYLRMDEKGSLTTSTRTIAWTEL